MPPMIIIIYQTLPWFSNISIYMNEAEHECPLLKILQEFIFVPIESIQEVVQFKCNLCGRMDVVYWCIEKNSCKI